MSRAAGWRGRGLPGAWQYAVAHVPCVHVWEGGGESEQRGRVGVDRGGVPEKGKNIKSVQHPVFPSGQPPQY